MVGHENLYALLRFHRAALIPHLIDAVIDILNPVQISAANMEPALLKEKYGSKYAFGAAAATRKTCLTAQTLPMCAPM